MKKNILPDVFLILLSLIFSIAPMFAFTEIPGILDRLMTERIGFPGLDQCRGEEAGRISEMYIRTLRLRFIGYISLAPVILLILLDHGAAGSMPVLEKALKDDDFETRINAREALKKLLHTCL